MPTPRPIILHATTRQLTYSFPTIEAACAWLRRQRARGARGHTLAMDTLRQYAARGRPIASTLIGRVEFKSAAFINPSHSHDRLAQSEEHT